MGHEAKLAISYHPEHKTKRQSLIHDAGQLANIPFGLGADMPTIIGGIAAIVTVIGIGLSRRKTHRADRKERSSQHTRTSGRESSARTSNATNTNVDNNTKGLKYYRRQDPRSRLERERGLIKQRFPRDEDRQKK